MSGETFERRVTTPALGAASLACGRPVTSELRLISPPQIAHSKVFSSYALPKSGCGERRLTFMVCPLQIMQTGLVLMPKCRASDMDMLRLRPSAQ
jgi:hypothetical protein